MRRVLTAIAILAVTALPSFAAGPSGMTQHPELKGAMMRNPQHLLMMAYHKNVLNFGQALARVARQGDTVPGEYARTVLSEMRRSVEEMEKYRAISMAAAPAGMQGSAEMQRMMDEHLVEVKTELRQLEDLARRDRIPSQEVLKHLQFISKGCQACVAMPGPASYCGAGNGEGPGRHGRMMAMMPERHQMMVEMMQKMKAQDAELLKQVERMNSAPKEKKVDLVADIVTQLVKQRAEMTSNMEKTQQMMHRQGAKQQGANSNGAAMPPPPGTPMFREGEGPDDEEDADIDTEEADDVYEMDDVTE